MAKEEEASFSPRMRARFKLVLQEIRTGEAQLKEDSHGRRQVECTNERTIPLGHVDKSKAHAIQVGKNAEDTRLLVETCLEMIEVIKWKQESSGVNTNETNCGVAICPAKVGIGDVGQYEKDQQFVHTNEVLGKNNCAGNIVVVKDKETGTEHVLKTVMISVFSTNEVRCWVDLGDSDQFPSLYLFQLKDNKVDLHMEKVEDGVELTDIIDTHMANLCKEEQKLIRPFSLCVFHGLLSAVEEMHDKNWAHRDLHGENVMLTKDTMMLKILDFGRAQPLRKGEGEGFSFNHDASKNDILNVIRLFCGVYIGNDFERQDILESKIKDGTLEKELEETARLGKEEKKELLQLIMMTYQVTQDPQQTGYGSTASVREHIEGNLFPAKVMEVMKQAAAVLFPDFNRPARDTALPGKGEEEVMDMTTNDSELQAAGKEIPHDLLQELSICIRKRV